MLFDLFIGQVLAWVALVLSILGAIGAVGLGLMGYIAIPAMETGSGANSISMISVIAGVTSGIAILVFGIVNFIVLLATAEFLHVQIDTEQNTRLGAEYMRQLLQTQLQAPSGQSPMPVEASPIATLLPEAYAAEPTMTTPSAPLRKD